MSKLLDQEKKSNKKRNKLSPLMKYAIVVLKNAIKDIMTGECNEDDVADIMVKLSPERHGYINPDDYLNYDKAMKEMPFGYNRNKLNSLMKEHGIENKRVNNMAIGFNKKEIQLLAKELREQENV